MINKKELITVIVAAAATIGVLVGCGTPPDHITSSSNVEVESRNEAGRQSDVTEQEDVR